MIEQETNGIVVKIDVLVGAHLNTFYLKIGVNNLDGGSVDATLNWWSCSRGPTRRPV
jgi:hypothetical protein